MKVVFTKDEHLALGFRNKFRKPGWEEDIIKKHRFIIEYMKENNIKYKVTTGDIFDKQTGWTFKQFLFNKKILEMYKQEGLMVISIAGNHDMLEGRENIKDSPFEEMVNDGLIKYIGDYGQAFDFIDPSSSGSIQARIRGIDYRNFNESYTKRDFFYEIETLFYENEKPKILVIHQNITPDRNTVTEFTYDEITKVCKEKGIEILVCGHYHVGYPTTIVNDVIVINPWNLWRVVRDYEVQQDNHTPEFVVLDLQTFEWEHVIVPHRKYQDAFNLIEIDTYKKIKKQFNFIETVDLNSIDDSDEENLIPIIINKLKEKEIEEEILQEVIKEVQSKIEI